MNDFSYYREIAERAYWYFKPDLRGQVVYSEAASGAYCILPAYALKSGAFVVLEAKDNKFSTKNEAIRQVESYMSYIGCDNKNLHIDYNNSYNKVTLALNTGNTRPYNQNKLEKMKQLKGISLMWEPWEIRNEEIDIGYCLKNSISIFGTNENHPYLSTFYMLGLSITKYLIDKGLSPFFDRFLFYGCEKFLGKIKEMSIFKYPEFVNRLDLSLDIGKYNAIVILENETSRFLFDSEMSEHNVDSIIHKNPSIKFVHICGNLRESDKKLLTDHGSDKWAKYGYMSVDAAYISAKAAIDLLIAGLKVAEDILNNRETGISIRYCDGS